VARPGRPKKTLQLASAIAREFTRRLLDRIADIRGRTEDFLRELTAIELNVGDIFLAKDDHALAQEFFDGVHRLAKAPTTSDWMKWRYSTHLFASQGSCGCGAATPPGRRTRPISVSRSPRGRTRGSTSSRAGASPRDRPAGAPVGTGKAALREALSVAEAIGNPPQLWKTHTALGRLHADLRQPETAWRAWEAARAVIERVRTGLRHERLRASLERAPEVRRVYELAAGA
jgi:hypothetical protein